MLNKASGGRELGRYILKMIIRMHCEFSQFQDEYKTLHSAFLRYKINTNSRIF
jgi:hypothetical protein